MTPRYPSFSGRPPVLQQTACTEASHVGAVQGLDGAWWRKVDGAWTEITKCPTCRKELR